MRTGSTTSGGATGSDETRVEEEGGDQDHGRERADTEPGECAAEGRDPAAVTVTHLGGAQIVDDSASRDARGAGTTDEHIGRYRELADAGVQTAIVGLADTTGPDAVSRFADVIAAFR